MNQDIRHLKENEPERLRERSRSRALLARADATSRMVHREAVELLALLDGPEMQRELEGIEDEFRRQHQ